MSYTTLISAADLASNLASDGWVVFDCRFDLGNPSAGYQAYCAAHVPGAHYAHLDNDLSSPVGPDTGRHPLPEATTLAAWLGKHGVDPDTQVVTYDAQGGAVAARMWWLLRWLGHDAVAVLDGGIKVWQESGFEMQEQQPSPHDVGPYPATVRSAMAIEVTELADALQHDQVRLLDARAPVRFRGEKEPLDKVAGHVPSAINHFFTEDLDAGGLFLSADALRDRLAQEIKPFPPDQTVCMCGSGVTACHTLLAMELAGLGGGRLYAGSWSEWITDPRRPVATGD